MLLTSVISTSSKKKEGEEKERCFRQFPTRNQRFPFPSVRPSSGVELRGTGEASDFLPFKGMKWRWSGRVRAGEEVVLYQLV